MVLQVNGKFSKKCTECTGKGYKMDYYLKKKALPVWIDENNKTHYELPECLLKLTLGEKMLIQKVAPFVPLQHIKNGTLGLQGHTCAFPQDIKGFVSTLPRMPMDVTVIQVLKNIKTEIGSKSATQKIFRIRRQEVLDALHFLKKYNPEFADIYIAESNMNWFDGKEGCLTTHVQLVEEMNTTEDSNVTTDDLGPCIQQAISPRLRGDDIVETGLFVADEPPILSENDKEINATLQPLVEEQVKNSNVN